MGPTAARFSRARQLSEVAVRYLPSLGFRSDLLPRDRVRPLYHLGAKNDHLKKNLFLALLTCLPPAADGPKPAQTGLQQPDLALPSLALDAAASAGHAGARRKPVRARERRRAAASARRPPTWRAQHAHVLASGSIFCGPSLVERPPYVLVRVMRCMWRSRGVRNRFSNFRTGSGHHDPAY